MALRARVLCRAALCTAMRPNAQIRSFAIAPRVHETNGTSHQFEPPTPELKRGEIVVVTSGKGKHSAMEPSHLMLAIRWRGEDYHSGELRVWPREGRLQDLLDRL